MLTTPFTVHSKMLGVYQSLIGGGNRSGLATLTFVNWNNLVIPVTHSEVIGDYTLVPGGLSPSTHIEQCDFLFSDCNGFIPKKGMFCNLRLNQNSATPVLAMQLWHGGLKEGGEIYRFALVDKSYKG